MHRWPILRPTLSRNSACPGTNIAIGLRRKKSGRFERVDGAVVAIAPDRAGHNDTKMLVWLALRQAVAAAGLPCHVYGDGMTVEVDDSDFEPDVVLHCGERLPRDAIAVPEPLVVVEVLSPSTRGVDLTHKMMAYFRVASVQHYLVFSADRPQVVHHRRRADGEEVDTRMLTEGVIRLDPPGISITLADVYGA
jgi:Uma2 family endonuclease